MSELSILGSKVQVPKSPEEAVLETFDNPAPQTIYLVPLVCTEFTSLCPKTGQPDFARFEILYVPEGKMIESKALKLYLFSFRNEGAFHESVTYRVFSDLWKVLKPRFLRVLCDFSVRGGISIKPVFLDFGPLCNDEERRKIVFLLENWDRIKPT